MGEIDVLQHRQGRRCGHGPAQFGSQKLALVQGLQDGGAALVQLEELFPAVTDGGDGHLVQAAGGLLAVAGDEGDGGALFQEGRGGGDGAGGHSEFAGNEVDMGGAHGTSVRDEQIRVLSGWG